MGPVELILSQFLFHCLQLLQVSLAVIFRGALLKFLLALDLLKKFFLHLITLLLKFLLGLFLFIFELLVIFLHKGEPFFLGHLLGPRIGRHRLVNIKAFQVSVALRE